MSTRANIIIKDDDDQLIFYRHSDGHPKATGESLKKFVKGYATKYRSNVSQSAGWLIIHGFNEYADCRYLEWQVGAYEPTTQLHCDVEYVYTIDLTKGVLSCRTPKSGFWDKPTLKNTDPCEGFKDFKFKVSCDD